MKPSTREYFTSRHHLREDGGLLYLGERVVIPTTLRKRVLDGLHSAHQGVFSMILRAQKAFFWPGIKADICKKREACISCMKNAPSNCTLPPHIPTTPQYPFQAICIDYMQYAGHRYGVMVDRFSGWPVVWKATEQTATQWLQSFCKEFGVPEEISTDGGPEFTSGLMADLLKDYGIKHRVSSAYNPHSNTRAEVAVRDIKRLLRQNVDSDGGLNNSRMVSALLTFKNTPDRDLRMSPSELVFGRQLNDMLPKGPHWTDSFGEDWKRTMVARETAHAGRKVKCFDNWSEHTKELPALVVGDHVAIQNCHGNRPTKWEKRGTVVSVEGYDKYGIKVAGSGRLTYRNRRHLRRYLPEILDTETNPQHLQESPPAQHIPLPSAGS